MVSISDSDEESRAAGSATVEAEPDDQEPAKLGLFGSRKRAKELLAQVGQLRAELKRLGAFSVIELEQRRDELATETAQQTVQLEEKRRQAA